MLFRMMSVLLLTTGLARADEVSDALQAALTAYGNGDLATTSQQIVVAQQAMGKQQNALMAALLPAAPEGWTRTDTEDFAQGFAIAGGGTGAEATYANADGSVSFRMSFIADNPMVASMAAMLGSPQMAQDNSSSTLVANRVLFQAQGATEDQMLPLVQLVDFTKVAGFDKK